MSTFVLMSVSPQLTLLPADNSGQSHAGSSMGAYYANVQGANTAILFSKFLALFPAMLNSYNMLPKDVANVARVLFTEINALNIIHMFAAIADNTLGGITL